MVHILSEGKKFLLKAWADLRSNYWAIPSLLSFGAVVLVGVTTYLDTTYSQFIFEVLPIHFTDATTARAILSTLAGSSITVAGVTFSMTLPAIVHASSQIGPRMLSGFMDNRTNQYVLGIFLASFTHGLVSLLNIEDIPSGEMKNAASGIPQLTMAVTFLYAGAAVVALIKFINHVPKSVRMTRNLSRVGQALRNEIENYFCEKDRFDTKKNNVDFRDKYPHRTTIQIDDYGYLQYVDFRSLVQDGEDKSVFIEVLGRPGQYIREGDEIAHLYSHEKIADEFKKKCQGHFALGDQQSVIQDFCFAANLLTEVAIRALSPGINDPNTAKECVDQLESGFLLLHEIQYKATHFKDSQSTARVIRPALDMNQIISDVFIPIIQYGADDYICYQKLMQSFKRLYQASNEPIYFQLSNRLANESDLNLTASYLEESTA